MKGSGLSALANVRADVEQQERRARRRQRRAARRAAAEREDVEDAAATTLQACAIAAPHLAQALLVSAVPKNWRAQLNAVQTDTLHCMSRRLRERRAKEILKAGYTLRCFTVNQPKRARQLLDWGVHGIISDYPDRILKVA